MAKSVSVNNAVPGNVFGYRNVLVLTGTSLACSQARHPPRVLGTAERYMSQALLATGRLQEGIEQRRFGNELIGTRRRLGLVPAGAEGAPC